MFQLIDWTLKSGDYGEIGAETITFSFLRNKGGNNEISMIPSIAVTKNAVQVHFYDSINNVFLQSGLVSLSEKGDKFIRPPAIRPIWLALNYNLFYTEIEFPKSGLHEMINIEKYSRDIKSADLLAYSGISTFQESQVYLFLFLDLQNIFFFILLLQ